MAERHTLAKDVQEDHYDSTESDLSKCTGSPESNLTQSSSFSSDGESQDPPLNDVTMACSDDGRSDIDVVGEGPMSSTRRVPPRDEKQGADDDGAPDHEKKGDDSSERETCDVSEMSKAVEWAKKKKRKARAAKAKEESNAERLAKKKRVKDTPVKKERTTRVKVKRPWSEAEKAAIQRQFGRFVSKRRIPRKEHCVKCLAEEKALSHRSWKDVRNYVYKTVL